MAGTGSRPVRLALVVALVAAAMLAGPAASQTVETDNTVTRIVIDDTGNATWTLHIRTRLDTEESVTQYESFQESFRSNESVYLSTYRDRIQSVVATAENATGREMTAVSFSASTSIQEVPRRWGVVTYEFTWVNFAETTDSTVSAGDVFQGGFFLAEGDTLEIVGPDGYELASTDPAPSEQSGSSATWIGREDFADERPSVTFETTTVATTTEPPTETTTTQTTVPPATGDGGLDTSLLAVLAIAAIALVGGGALWYRRGGTSAVADPGGQTAGLVTDEDRVVRLLESNDGRLKQRDIQDELGWSSSKTSRVLQSMTDAGTLEKLRLGRENVISLVDDE